MLSLAELEQLSQTEMSEAHKTKLADIQDININPLQSPRQRMESYLEQIKNPYLFMCGDMAVKVNFAQGSQELKHKLTSYYINTNKG